MAQRTSVTLPQAERRYSIVVEGGLLAHAGDLIREVLPNASRIFIITDTSVAPLYLPRLSEGFQQSGLTVFAEMLPPGEDYKTLETVEALYDKALSAGLKRNDVIVALGGGIVGDITGFFAATYMRGVPFVQVPTTLLAQVDASVGGKVAVNRQHFKNIVGAFYHPKAVLIDTQTLQTLPEQDFACGMAEVIKYALITESIPNFPDHSTLWPLLQQGAPKHEVDLEQIILLCCQMKAAVVQADPEERLGIREILNLGHTFAHAYETLSMGEIPHGEAVSLGVVKAYQLASALGQISEETVNPVIAILQAHHLPTDAPKASSPDVIIKAMLQDKKALSPDALRLVLPYDRLGKVRVQENVSIDVVRSLL